MLSFKNFIKEASDGSVTKQPSHHVMAFGRMNPPTIGHEQVVNKIHDVAKEHKASHQLVLSGSHDTTEKEKKAGKNPLPANVKEKHAKRAFPGTNVKAAERGETILHHAAKAHAAGVEHLHVVAGSDRHEELKKLLHKYNGQNSAHGHYNFKSISMHSSGERDPDSEDSEENHDKPKEKKPEDTIKSISGSKMRSHAAAGNKKDFHASLPSKMKPEHKDALYKDLRKHMGHKD